MASTFVWIPVFMAYQLIVPANCGGDNTTKPVGYWVAIQPSTGTDSTAHLTWPRLTSAAPCLTYAPSTLRPGACGRARGEAN